MGQGQIPPRGVGRGWGCIVTEVERRAALDAIGAEVSVCTRCRLHETRTKSVPGEGTSDSEVIFVGEGPGYNEDQQGRPFVGRAGSLLGKLLDSIGWSRDVVFITNVVKCRPPDNRDPEPDEIAACAPFLTRQIAALDPALIVTLGRVSMGRFNPGAKIGQVHGTFRPAHAEAEAANALAFFMYHPAAALRDPAVEATSFRDMQGIPPALLAARKMRAGVVEGAASPATQPADRPVPQVAISVVPAPADADMLAGELSHGGENVHTDAQSGPTDQPPLF